MSPVEVNLNDCKEKEIDQTTENTATISNSRTEFLKRHLQFNKEFILEYGKQIYPCVAFILALCIVHYIVTLLYKDYCIITPYSFYNIVFSVSPMCSYLLDIINICNGSLTKLWYIFGGYIIIKLTTVFGKLNVFSNYSRRPEMREELSVH